MECKAHNLSEAYAQYVIVDVKNDVKSVEDAIDDTLTRLDEFSGLVDLIRNQNHPEIAVDILSRKGELIALFQRVRKFELVVSQVRQTVDAFEHQVSAAERELNCSPEAKILNLFKPLFKKKTSVPATSLVPSDTSSCNFVAPPIFDTKEIFSTPPDS